MRRPLQPLPSAEDIKLVALGAHPRGGSVKGHTLGSFVSVAELALAGTERDCRVSASWC